MTMSIKIDRRASRLTPLFIAKVQTDFYKGAAELLPIVIQDTILKGISPVQGVGRFTKYSQSYIDQIEGRVQFRFINGKAVPFTPKTKIKRESLYGTAFNAGAKKGQNLHDRYKKGTTSKISYSKTFGKGLGVGKLKSPVNMSVTNSMLNSLAAKATAYYTEIFFTSPIAKFHNDLGAGKSKVIRPLLPSKSGQRFTALINKKLNDLLNELLGFKKN